VKRQRSSRFLHHVFVSKEQIDAYHRPNLALRQDFQQESGGFRRSPKIGEVMSRSEIQAMICVGKIGINSSIQAQGTGEVMSQNWRIYESYATLLMSNVVY
jgi:hypothetical protein